MIGGKQSWLDLWPVRKPITKLVRQTSQWDTRLQNQLAVWLVDFLSIIGSLSCDLPFDFISIAKLVSKCGVILRDQTSAHDSSSWETVGFLFINVDLSRDWLRTCTCTHFIQQFYFILLLTYASFRHIVRFSSFCFVLFLFCV